MTDEPEKRELPTALKVKLDENGEIVAYTTDDWSSWTGLIPSEDDEEREAVWRQDAEEKADQRFVDGMEYGAEVERNEFLELLDQPIEDFCDDLEDRVEENEPSPEALIWEVRNQLKEELRREIEEND